MPRIPYAEPGTEAEGATPVYQELEKSFGRVPNLVQLLGHSGPATQALGTVMRIYFQDLSISPRIRELAYLTVARHNGCTYCQSHHRPMAVQAGVPEAKLEKLGPEGFDSEDLDEAERAVVRFAWETSHDVVASDEAVEALRRHFSNTEIAEIAFAVASGNFIQRIGRNFGVELES